MSEQPGSDTGLTLSSWRPGGAREEILDFVARVTTGSETVPPEERIAVLDNDGTLWSEKPMPTQLHFLVEQWAEAARRDPALAEQEPYRSAATGEFHWLAAAVDKHYAGDDSDLHRMVGAILANTKGMSVEDYQSAVAAFYRDAKHPTLGRPYSGTVYQPMVELLRLLEDAGFACYVVSGGDRDFIRPMTVDNYGIPPERVVGSAVGLEYDEEGGEVRYGSTFSFLDDGPEKPVRIWSRIGRRPLVAVGNSNGDVPMLRFVQGHPRSLSLVIHHDDDTGRGDPPYDQGAEEALAGVDTHGFTRVSVRDDWAEVFPAAGGRT